VLEQAGAGIGERHAAPIALEECLAEFDFELPDLAAQRRLHHGEKRGGAREAPEFRDVAKVFELFQIHVPLGFMPYAYLLYQVYHSFLDSIRDNRHG
jgi:hypothetical protein